jgi:hypothetical protein
MHPHKYNAMCNVMAHESVSVDKEYTDVAIDKRQTQTQLYEVIAPLLGTKPNWRFVATNASHTSGIVVFNEFKVYEDSEYLGMFGVGYHGRDYKIIVNNERINAKRERGRGYKTEEPAKALLAIRKYFYRLGQSERIEKILDEAKNVLQRESSSKGYDTRRALGNLFGDSDNFAKANLSQYLAQFPQHVDHYKKFEEAQEIEMVVDSVKDAFDKRESIVVVLDGAHYIVMHPGDTKTYNNDTLPYALREKVGLLKLVEDHQMISNVGCRVSADAFVLLPTKSEGDSE